MFLIRVINCPLANSERAYNIEVNTALIILVFILSWTFVLGFEQTEEPNS
jgi:hypothetical protein